MTATNPAVVGEREAFEVWYRSIHMPGERRPSELAWAAWQAARAPLRDAPPPTVGGGHGSVEGAAAVTSETVTSSLSGGASVADELILQAVARGWCSPENQHKEMDAALAGAIAREVSAALRAVGVAEQWRPIETAPRDGSRFLGWPVFGYTTCRECRFSEFEREFIACGSGTHMQELQFWMPLPPPPAAAGGKA